MAELDIEETNELLRNLNRTIADLSGQLGGLSNGATAASRAYRAQTDAQGKASQGMDGLTRSTKGLTEAELARIDAQKKIAAAEAQIADAANKAKEALGSFAGALLQQDAKLNSFGNSLDSAGDAAFALGKAFGPIGMIIGGIVKGFTMLTKANLEITQAYLDGKNTLAKMGGAGTITTKELEKMARGADLNAATLDRMIKPMQGMGSSIMALGTNAGDAQKNFASLIKATEEERKQMMRLGINQEQMMQGTADYLALQSMSGRSLRGEMMDREKLRKSSQEYQTNLMDLAALTGKDVNELKEKQKAMMMDRAVQIKTIQDSLKEKQLREAAAKETDAGRKAELLAKADALKAEIDNRNKAFQSLAGAPEALRKGIQQLTTGTISGADAQKLARLGLQKDIDEFNRTIKNGGDQAKAAAKLQDAYQRAQEKAIVTVGRSAAINEEVAKNYALNSEKDLETTGQRIGASYEEDLKIQRERRAAAQQAGKDNAADMQAGLQETQIKAAGAVEDLIRTLNPLKLGFVGLAAAAGAAALALGIMAKKGMFSPGGMGEAGGGILSKIFGGGGGGAAAGAGAKVAGAAGAGAKVAGAAGAGGAGEVVEQLGGKGGGMLEGAAKGLRAFANPQVVLGAAGLGAAITAIGAGIAGATWIMGKALPSLAGGLKAFEELDGNKLVTTGKGILALGGGLAVFGAGGAAAGIGGIIGGLGEKFGKALGIDGPFKKLQEFSKLDIDAPKVKANAEAFMAFNKAMAAGGAGGAVAGVGNLLSGISEKLGGKLNLRGPLEKMKEFESVQIDAKKIKGNAEAFGIFTEAMGKFKPPAGSGLGAALVKGVADFFEVKPPVEQMKEFAAISLGDDGPKRVKQNAQAFIYFAKAMESFKGTGQTIGGEVARGVANFLEAEPPMEQLKKFAAISVTKEQLETIKLNAEAFGIFSKAMAEFKGAPTGSIGNSIATAVSSFFEIDPPMEQMKRFASNEMTKDQVQNVKYNAQAFVYFSKAMDSYKGTGQTATGVLAEAASNYFSLDPPVDKMQKFAQINMGGEAGVKRVKANADAFVAFSNAMASYKGGGELTNAVDSIVGGVTKMLGGDDVITKFVKFTKLDVNPDKASKLAQAFLNYANAMAGGTAKSGAAASGGGGGGGGGGGSSAAPASAGSGGGGGSSGAGGSGGGLMARAASFLGFGGGENDPDAAADSGVSEKGKPQSEKPQNVKLASSADVSGVDPSLLKAFYGAAAEYGKPISVNSAYRGDQKQAELWVRGRVLGDPGVHTPAKPKNNTTINYKGTQYNVPGSGKGSKHREGDALDISVDHRTFDPILAKYNLHRPYKDKDPPHVEIKAEKGGLASGPKTGYPATLHGNEMIIPLDPNSLLAELGKKTKAETQNDMKQNSALSEMSPEISKELVAINQQMMDMLSNKLDSMIDKLSTSNDTQNKLLKYSQA